MASITSSILALLAAAPEPAVAETVPEPAAAVASDTATEPGTVASVSVSPEGEETDPASDAAEPEASPKDDYEGGLHVDRYGAVETVDVTNIAGTSIPTSMPRAFPKGPQRGLFNDPFNRGSRYSARGGGPTPPGKWVFEYHGFFRAPFRAGMGERAAPPENPEAPALGDRVDGQSKFSVHDPVVPDDQYLDYQYTKHTPRDWAELYFSYGNGIATGTVAIMGFNFSDGAWKEDGPQFGIAQAYATLTPKFKARFVKLMWRVGIFNARYGMSGRYDQGDIETYLFGRTHSMGEALMVDFQVNDDFTVWVEHGVGATRPDPSEYNNGRFTFLHHAHVGFRYQRKLEFNVHWLNAFANEADRIGQTMSDSAGGRGRVHVVGPELRIDWGRLGFMYGGFSYINLKNGLPLSRAIEVVHSLGGGQFRHGLDYLYLGGANSGEIYSVIAQFENSIQKIRKGSAWYGQGPDLVAKLFFMVNKVRTDVPDEDVAGIVGSTEDPDVPLGGADGDVKFKIGGDLQGQIFPWFGIGVRATHIAPDSDYDEQNFTILSPRLTFQTNFLTHEVIELQYSRYFYNERICPEEDPTTAENERLLCVQPQKNPVAPTGFGASQFTQEQGIRQSNILAGPFPHAPDENVFMIKVSIWW